ncbi:MAG: SMP-30/gluconolactonase/LRE family protein [Chloroflexi bacterium]|nr:SMP-30/gluconolactonase/LRE family protein [Chloroflexota bacterium]
MKLGDLFESPEWRQIASDLQFTEGPLWHPDGYLLFSDIPASIIYRLVLGERPQPWRTPSGHANGLTWDRQGRLIACEHGNRRVSRTEADGTIITVASHYQGKRLNSPNDVVVRSDGSIYFTDPPYGIREEQKELPWHGVYRVSPGGEIQLLVDDFDRPNGLAFSPDEKTLYIDDTSRRHIRAFDVREDGTLTNSRFFAHMESDMPGGPDGMKVDVEGNIYCAGPGALWMYEPNGDPIGVLVGPQRPANLAFGGPDRRTLFVTARTGVYMLRTKIPGMPVF